MTAGATAESRHPAAAVSFVSWLPRNCWSAYRKRRERARVRGTLYGMQDRELNDIGITRSEIEYVVFCDPVRAYPTRARNP